MTSGGNLFQWLVVLWLKEFALTFLSNMGVTSVWPLRFLFSLRNKMGNVVWLIPVMHLHVSIKSPHNRRLSRGKRFKAFNLLK